MVGSPVQRSLRQLCIPPRRTNGQLDGLLVRMRLQVQSVNDAADGVGGVERCRRSRDSPRCFCLLHAGGGAAATEVLVTAFYGTQQRQTLLLCQSENSKKTVEFGVAESRKM